MTVQVIISLWDELPESSVTCYLYLHNSPYNLMDARGLFDYLCVCQLIKQPIGEAVSNIIDGRRCGRSNIGEEFTRIDTAGCNPVYSWLECYCKKRSCELTTKYKCISKRGRLVPIIHVWRIESSNITGCHD